ncbi:MULTISPECIES: hypothetical protein [unclassified Coleofasciculus]|uniref:hypothetical protein n=1 Tax=unclassified Coleofasciculus TaxID=2692782 RepID=UPI001881DA15|nr:MULTISPECIES: hypothetical protein [unclassified Coleofasciculus]MBE9127881.1 hypothetical protein [Coleofasciculus sp. LEGE 07081]MBE9151073.1 hypothetical protein [Coleofasciculus sp. LEGE 07092]
MNNTQRKALLKLAAKVLQDPQMLRKMSDRVYELMQEDLRTKVERRRYYRGFF